MCRLVAICLHYFYLAAFSWLFVEMLHLYRRLIEIRDINHGTMKFYYLLGYGQLSAIFVLCFSSKEGLIGGFLVKDK